ncbi:hypothetical protein BKM35_22135 [Salmonella enterica]|nr:hypothetical protein [Salmonella enterica]
MAIIKNDSGLLCIPSSGFAGVVHQQRFEINIPAGLNTGDIIELGVLLANARICGCLLDADVQTDMVVDIGFMSGDVGSDDQSRTCGNEIFNDQKVDGNLTMITTGAPLRLAKSDVDRSIGVKVVTKASAENVGGVFALEVAYCE